MLQSGIVQLTRYCFVYNSCNASRNLSSSTKAVMYSTILCHSDGNPRLTSPFLPTRRYDVADFEILESPRDESSFSHTMERTFLSESLLISFSLSIFVDPSVPSSVSLYSIVAAGVARIHPQ